MSWLPIGNTHRGEERHPDQKGSGDDDVSGLDVNLPDGLHIEQSVELPGAADDALSRSGSEKRN